MSVLNRPSRAARIRAAVVQDRERAIVERRYVRRFIGEFNRVARETGDAYALQGTVSAALSATGQHDMKLYNLLTRLYGDTMEKFVAMTAEDLLPEKSARYPWSEYKQVNDVPPEFDEFIEQWIAENALEKSKLLSGTTLDDLRRIISEGTRESLGQAEIGKLIQKRIGVIGRARARVIARTESHTASQSSSLEVANRSPAVQVKVWTSVLDERTRSDHQEADGQRRKLNELFEVGGSLLRFPGDPNGPPGETINCRCVMLYEPENGSF